VIPARDVGEQLLDEPFRFEFFQAVRMLERVYPGRQPVGYHADPTDEVVRFHAHNTLSFPASEVVDIRPPSETDGGRQSGMTVAFMGLTGPLGTLPSHYTALLSDPSRRKQTESLAAFLDVFTHRFVSLFYRAWEKYRFPVAYERGQGDAFSNHLFCLIGLGTEGLQRRLEFTDEVLLYYAGLLAQRPRSAAALEAILADYFDVPVNVEQFTGQWFLMNPDTLTSLGGWNHQLGVTTVLWQRVFDPQARFRVTLGPLDYDHFQAFLPTGRAYAELVDLTRFFAGDDLSFEIQPLLRHDAVPWCTLGADPGQRLGWSMWLKTRPLSVEDHVPQPLFEAHLATPLASEAVAS
jgi:type VI secretion system protein ImpH